MSRMPKKELRRGWTTGACATAATKAALTALWGGELLNCVTITLPRGETPKFDIDTCELRSGLATACVIKDAGDDPDVTHGASIVATVREIAETPAFVRFKAGDGVGVVTKPGLPIGVGEAAINPVPRQMMEAVVDELCAAYGRKTGLEIEISVPGGKVLAQKTWNPRLGIEGGISILGTTGIVRPFSCAAWIASIHRGIDVARASGLTHVAGCTGATSEQTVQDLYGLSDHAMLDMGDFAGGMIKYLAKNPVDRLTIGGGFGKLTKLAQGAVDLHSARSQVDFERLGQRADQIDCDGDGVRGANTALEALGIASGLPQAIAEDALRNVQPKVPDIKVDVVVVSRSGEVLGHAE